MNQKLLSDRLGSNKLYTILKKFDSFRLDVSTCVYNSRCLQLCRTLLFLFSMYNSEREMSNP